MGLLDNLVKRIANEVNKAPNVIQGAIAVTTQTMYLGVGGNSNDTR